jgi:hypothetical protein
VNAQKQNQYLLLFRGDEWFNELSPGQLQDLMDRSKAWIDRLVAQGKVRAHQALGREGAVLSGGNKRVISDGPFAESKEAVGGYLLLSANSLEEAIAIANESPALSYRSTIEVRPVAQECPLDTRARELAGADLTQTAA